MKIGMMVGAALVFAPVVAFADQTQPGSNATTQTNTQQQQQQQQRATRDTSAQQNSNGQQELTTKKLLPADAKLVGTIESADVRAFPEQMNEKAQQSSRVEKEGVVGVGGIDRVWQTKQAYGQTVRQLDQKLKGEGIEPVAKTTTQTSTGWNIRMPDGNIANVVVRNTKPTTIESIQAEEMAGTMTETGGSQQNAPSTKTKSTDTTHNTDNGNTNSPAREGQQH